MSAAAAPAAEPILAERTRSVLARAVSLTVTTHGLRHDPVGLHCVNARGQVRMRLQADGLPGARRAEPWPRWWSSPTSPPSPYATGCGPG
ncbi:hypothetical protein [Streptomyces virginiae]|uniref:hypothetical protein n=1 Tax=Streptomyces virginiae TaxID=1961 RepID=UPI00341997FC